MAKQMEGFLEGTYGDITFYKMEGKYYARMKSSLTGKTFWQHKSFEGSRRSCSRFGRGNQLASFVYNEIVKEKREYALFCKMKSVAIRMIKYGCSEEEVIDGLRMMKPAEKTAISQFDNSTIRQWEQGNNLKTRGFCARSEQGRFENEGEEFESRDENYHKGCRIRKGRRERVDDG